MTCGHFSKVEKNRGIHFSKSQGGGSGRKGEENRVEIIFMSSPAKWCMDREKLREREREVGGEEVEKKMNDRK